MLSQLRSKSGNMSLQNDAPVADFASHLVHSYGLADLASHFVHSDGLADLASLIQQRCVQQVRSVMAEDDQIDIVPTAMLYDAAVEVRRLVAVPHLEHGYILVIAR